MKLNNRGWGLTQMIIMSTILFFLLFVVSYYIYVFYNKLDERDGSQYFALESKLKSAAVLYSKNISSPSGRVSLYTLKSLGYIDTFNDEDGRVCNGYVIYNDDRFDSYIRCNGFVSSNYDRNYE